MASECIDSFLVALKRTMVAICRVSRYKDGAFEAAVTTDSAVLDDLRTIISSPLLTTHEKSVFSQVKRAAINLRNMKARGEKPDDLRILNEGMCVMAMDDVVGTDCKARGQYKPPTMYQIIGADGEVEETVTIDHENKIEKYKGGKPMVVPGAPKSFNQAQTKAFGETFGDTFNLESKLVVPRNTAPHTFESDIHVREDTKTEQAPTELTAESIPSLKSENNGGFGGFGESFEENLKSAFL